MSKYVFCDSRKKLYIKVCLNKEKALRELGGVEVLKNFACVPKVKQIDSRTLLVSSSDGKIAKDNKKLNQYLISYFATIKGYPLKTKEKFVSIFDELNNLRQIFSFSSRALVLINQIEKKVGEQSLFPVHGDLQMQNIFLCSRGLCLIDFEHFTFAPLELDLCNSLFFNDGNCLDVDYLIKVLCQKKIFTDATVYWMLIFYSLKQAAYERSIQEANARLARAMDRLNKILGSNYQSIDISEIIVGNERPKVGCLSQFYF